ncbi:PREDICTED: cytochrome P450 84A1-like [Tarenaya hassleriana]|uniref:cytochrome P450 84A1-like n=1 Tax=Tarenaya hassleriana TaxID=28532 RepID=UPI00053C7BD8|nr:PREDICTED: cytochrome P450 84A1-like [Tarenaya hassleriana]
MNVTILTTAVLSIMILLYGVVSWLHRRRLPYPPGPAGLPIVGNFNILDKMTHRGLAELSERFGGLFHVRVGFLHMFAVSSPEIARQVLQVHDGVFSNRPATAAIRYLTYDRADMAFAHYGPFWRQMRKLCVVKLFSRKRAESWASVRDEVDKMVRLVETHSDQPVNVGELIFSLTRNIIYRAAFGSASDEGQDEFVKILQEFSKLFGAFNIADFLPFLGWIDPHGIKGRTKRARASLDQFIDTIIDKHVEKKKKNRSTGDGGDPNEDTTDMVDELLAFCGDGNAENESAADPNNTIELTRDNIKAIIMDVMFGGTETVASAIEWTMSELLRSPDEFKQVQSELADAVGLERRVEDTDLPMLPYLKCVVKETLRLHPPIPLLLHETAEDAEVAGYFIPKGSRVMINAWAIGRDPASWEDPDSFRPSRFLEQGAADFRGSSFEFIPFGSGRRSCPGMQLGLYALELAVANLLHCFTWDLPDETKPSELDMADMFGLTAPRASRLLAVPSKRVIYTL